MGPESNPIQKLSPLPSEIKQEYDKAQKEGRDPEQAVKDFLERFEVANARFRENTPK